MKETTISVIVPNYNNESFLKECISSIVTQSRKPDEIIIVDDCSTDNSVDIIRELEDRYECVKSILLSNNQGVSNARNIGALNATSEYITFTDSDDYYYSKNKLKNELELIEKYKEKGQDVIVYSTIVNVDNEGNRLTNLQLRRNWYLKGDIFEELVARVKLENLPRDYCVKKEIFHKVGGYCYHKDFYEDLDLLLRLSKEVFFYPTYQYGIAYRDSINGLSKRNVEEHIEAVNSIIEQYKRDVPEYKILFHKMKWKSYRFIYRVWMKINKSIKVFYKAV